MTTPRRDGTDALQLPLHPHAPLLARTFIHQVGDTSPADVLDDATLATSELVSNAVRHAASDISLVVKVRPESVRVEVHDDGEAVIRARRPDGGPALSVADDEHGRGLFIVAAIADRGGVEEQVPPPGKSLWLEIQLPDDADTPDDGFVTEVGSDPP